MNNQLILVGNVSQAPVSKLFTDTGNKVVKFSIAVKEFTGGKEEAMFIDIDAWNGLGERVLKTITKGREVVLVGRLSLKEIKDENGKIKYNKPVMTLTSFHLCGPKPKTAAADTTASAESTDSADSSADSEATARIAS